MKFLLMAFSVVSLTWSKPQLPHTDFRLLGFERSLQTAISNPGKMVQDTCKTCIALVNSIKSQFGPELTTKCTAALIEYTCRRYQNKTENFCSGLAEEYKLEFAFVFNNLGPNTAAQVCNMLIYGGQCGPSPVSNWTIPLPGNKPPDEKLSLPKKGSPTLRVLHFSDLHIDRSYTDGGEANCQEIMCCRNTSVLKDGEQSKKAGKWGTIGKCDIPPRLAENMFQHLKNQTFDYIIWTGDITPHNIWNEQADDLIADMELLTNWLLKYFPDTPIYSAIGNHETVPDHSYLWLNQTDPDGTMTWLVEELTAAEKSGEKVHIIGHIPPGTTALKQWSDNYYNVVNRFSNTIRGQFFGHTHKDAVSLFYADANPNKTATNMIYICPSVTTDSYLMPTYRIYTIDGNHGNSTWSVLNAETYVMDVNQANKDDNPKWTLEYKTKETYGMSSLFPQDWNNLIRTFQSNDTLFQKYAKHHMRSQRFAQGCTGACKYKLLCQMRTSRTHDEKNLCGDLPGHKQHYGMTLLEELSAVLQYFKIRNSLTAGHFSDKCNQHHPTSSNATANKAFLTLNVTLLYLLLFAISSET